MSPRAYLFREPGGLKAKRFRGKVRKSHHFANVASLG
jgi:hypothetical protein